MAQIRLRGAFVPLDARSQSNRARHLYDHERAVATATLGLDSEIGLLVDELYRDESEALRRSGRQLCAMTKLAVEHLVKSKRVLASLFHISLIYAPYFFSKAEEAGIVGRLQALR